MGFRVRGKKDRLADIITNQASAQFATKQANTMSQYIVLILNTCCRSDDSFGSHRSGRVDYI